MKEQFIDHRFNAVSLKTIEMVNSILAEYAGQGYRLSLRQLYYQAEQVESAESWAEVTERHMSEKLRLAKEDAENARRETEDERRRKEDLQDKLDKAEKKAKRSE